MQDEDVVSALHGCCNCAPATDQSIQSRASMEGKPFWHQVHSILHVNLAMLNCMAARSREGVGPQIDCFLRCKVVWVGQHVIHSVCWHGPTGWMKMEDTYKS